METQGLVTFDYCEINSFFVSHTTSNFLATGCQTDEKLMTRGQLLNAGALSSGPLYAKPCLSGYFRADRARTSDRLDKTGIERRRGKLKRGARAIRNNLEAITRGVSSFSRDCSAFLPSSGVGKVNHRKVRCEYGTSLLLKADGR